MQRSLRPRDVPALRKLQREGQEHRTAEACIAALRERLARLEREVQAAMVKTKGLHRSIRPPHQFLHRKVIADYGLIQTPHFFRETLIAVRSRCHTRHFAHRIPVL